MLRRFDWQTSRCRGRQVNMPSTQRSLSLAFFPVMSLLIANCQGLQCILLADWHPNPQHTAQSVQVIKDSTRCTRWRKRPNLALDATRRTSGHRTGTPATMILPLSPLSVLRLSGRASSRAGTEMS